MKYTLVVQTIRPWKCLKSWKDSLMNAISELRQKGTRMKWFLSSRIFKTFKLKRILKYTQFLLIKKTFKMIGAWSYKYSRYPAKQ